MSNTAHNEALFLVNELLRDGHTEATLPLPQGKLRAIEERDEKLDERDLANLRLAYANSHHRP